MESVLALVNYPEQLNMLRNALWAFLSMSGFGGDLGEVGGNDWVLPALGLFFVLALVWWWTGRLWPVGVLVRLLWFPVQVVLLVLGGFCRFMTLHLAGSYSVGKFVLVGWLLYSVFIASDRVGELWFPVAAWIGGCYGFSLLFGNGLLTLARWKPTARRTPPPRLRQRPPPVVRVAVPLPKSRGGFEREAQIVKQLPQHLQALIRGNIARGKGGRQGR